MLTGAEAIVNFKADSTYAYWSSTGSGIDHRRSFPANWNLVDHQAYNILLARFILLMRLPRLWR